MQNYSTTDEIDRLDLKIEKCNYMLQNVARKDDIMPDVYDIKNSLDEAISNYKKFNLF